MHRLVQRQLPRAEVQHLLKKKYRAFLKIPKIARTINRLIMGTHAGRPQMPMFMAVGNADGKGDDVMVAKDVEALAHQYCSEGATVQYTVYSGAKHTEAGLQFFPQAMQFLGRAVRRGCRSRATARRSARATR